jgi:hypothetical protein
MVVIVGHALSRTLMGRNRLAINHRNGKMGLVRLSRPAGEEPTAPMLFRIEEKPMQGVTNNAAASSVGLDH